METGQAQQITTEQLQLQQKLPSICCYHGDSTVQSERVGGDVSGVCLCVCE